MIKKLFFVLVALTFSIVAYSQTSTLPTEIVINDFMSPNKDKKNDAFFIENIQLYEDSEIQIFSRWGDLVYEATNYQNDWKGKTNRGSAIGKDVTDGVYYYIIKIPSFNQEYKGTITLIR